MQRLSFEKSSVVKQQFLISFLLPLIGLGFLVRLAAPAHAAPAHPRPAAEQSPAEASKPVSHAKTRQSIAELFVLLYPSFQAQPALEESNVIRFVESFGAKEVQIVLTESEHPNAFAIPEEREGASKSQIVVSHTLLDQLSSRSEIAFVLAHEMTHVTSEHVPLLPPFVLTAAQLKHISAVHRSWEFEADAAALRLLEERGLNLDAPASVLAKLAAAEKKHADHSDSDHPPISERIIALNRHRTATSS